jgi:hypothetical protein
MQITATFSTGKTIQRTTTKTYTHAYWAENIYQGTTGFASSEEKARKAAASAFRGCPPAHTIEIVEVKTV